MKHSYNKKYNNSNTTIITLINFALHEKLKGVVITLHHKFYLL